MPEELTEREQLILHFIVGEYVACATPVGSRTLWERHNLGLSPATIRNVMADLEEAGYLQHPHTSAGRMPTDKGYRFYVNYLMGVEEIPDSDRQAIGRTLEDASNPDTLLTEASRILGRISHQLSLVSSPFIRGAILKRLELLQVTSSKIAVVLSVESGLVKTIVMEVRNDVRREQLEDITRFLNERLTGQTLENIRTTFASRVKDAEDEETGIVRLLMKSAGKLFDDIWTWKNVHIGGTPEVIDQPEFGKPEAFRAFLSLVDDEEVMSRMFSHRLSNLEGVNVTIGEEHEERKLQDYATVASVYRVGDAVGMVGVIGPKRMRYSRVIPLVDHMARTISSILS
jgi:heat-inducible transcriptional repressor